MSLELESFLSREPNFSKLPPAAQNELLLYAMVSNGKQSVTASEIDAARERLNLQRFGTANQLSVNSRTRRGSRPRFVKAAKGYSLERGLFEDFHQKYGGRATAKAVNRDLRAHLAGLADPDLKEYLTETVDCFERSYFRAAIVMAWCAAYAIFRKCLFTKHLPAINSAMSSWKTPRSIIRIEDFDELAERVVLDTARTAAILTKEQHKQLVALLDQRNSFAHPSGRKVSSPIAEAYLVQIIDEVVAKFS